MRVVVVVMRRRRLMPCWRSVVRFRVGVPGGVRKGVGDAILVM